jgi:hypothetical protein
VPSKTASLFPLRVKEEKKKKKKKERDEERDPKDRN